MSRPNAVFNSIPPPERSRYERPAISGGRNGVARCPAMLVAGTMGARARVGRDELRATPRDVARPPGDDYRWDSAETREGPTCGRSANRARQLASSWSRSDHEDGGPTIPLPAADARCTLRSLSGVQYMRLEPYTRCNGAPWGASDWNRTVTSSSEAQKYSPPKLMSPYPSLVPTELAADPFVSQFRNSRMSSTPSGFNSRKPRFERVPGGNASRDSKPGVLTTARSNRP